MKSKQPTLGIVFGTFAPLHTGHQSLINQALTDNQQVLIIVCGSDMDRGQQIGLSLDYRYQLVQDEYTNNSKISVRYLNQTDLPSFPKGEIKWLERFQSIFTPLTAKDTEVTIYFGEAAYDRPLRKYFPKARLVLADRQKIKVSATSIRQNPHAHKKYIAKAFQKKWLNLL